MIGVVDSPSALSTQTLPGVYPAPAPAGVLTRTGRGLRRIAVFLFELLTNVG